MDRVTKAVLGATVVGVAVIAVMAGQAPAPAPTRLPTVRAIVASAEIPENRLWRFVVDRPESVWDEAENVTFYVSVSSTPGLPAGWLPFSQMSVAAGSRQVESQPWLMADGQYVAIKARGSTGWERQSFEARPPSIFGESEPLAGRR